jgi:tetratricopeptide (TPR) repeat protein
MPCGQPGHVLPPPGAPRTGGGCPGQAAQAAVAAREAVGLSRQALLDTPDTGTAFDAVCGELVERINDLGQILLSLGQDEQARQMLEHAAAEDPTTVFDLGQALRLLGEGYILRGQARPAAATLAEAHAIFARFDGRAAQDLARHTSDLLERLREVVSARSGNAGSADPTGGTGDGDHGRPGQAAAWYEQRHEPSAPYGLPPWTADDLSETVAEPYKCFDEGMKLLLRGDAAAVGPLKQAAGMFALLTADDEPTQQNLALQRRLALSFWRLMQACLVAGQAAEGLRSGQLSVTVGVGLLQSLPSGHPDRADVLAETLTVIAEVSEVTLRSAGQGDDAIGLLRVAAGLAGRDPHPAVRQALGRARQVSELIARLAPGEAATARAAGVWTF